MVTAHLPGSSISDQNRLIIQARWLKDSFREGVQNVSDYYRNWKNTCNNPND
jgi:hypothetical protein